MTPREALLAEQARQARRLAAQLRTVERWAGLLPPGTATGAPEDAAQSAQAAVPGVAAGWSDGLPPAREMPAPRPARGAEGDATAPPSRHGTAGTGPRPDSGPDRIAARLAPPPGQPRAPRAQATVDLPDHPAPAGPPGGPAAFPDRPQAALPPTAPSPSAPATARAPDWAGRPAPATPSPPDARTVLAPPPTGAAPRRSPAPAGAGPVGRQAPAAPAASGASAPTAMPARPDPGAEAPGLPARHADLPSRFDAPAAADLARPDLFAASELEDALADVLERATREAGIDLA